MTTSHAGRDGTADGRAVFEIVGRSGEAAAVLAARVPRPSLDYYVIYPQRPDGDHSAEPEAILVEEFVLAEDYSAVRLHSAGWTSKDRRWWGSSAVSRDVRVDAKLRSRVVGVDRHDTEAAYRKLGGGELPDEETLRGYFDDGEPLYTSAPLRLEPGRAAPGFHETRIYRILFANDLSQDDLASLRARWRMTTAGNVADPQARVLGTVHLRVGEDVFTWDLRRIGIGAAWSVDLTANLSSSRDDAAGYLLRELSATMRAQGLIPVTIERFS